jgi:ribose transport system ATP-binding protein
MPHEDETRRVPVSDPPPATDPTAATGSALLSLRGIVKRFPGVLALCGVDFDLRRGETHALLGENGAGKSTLMKIIAGMIQPDEGTIHLDGRPRRFAHALDARDAGIALIHQELCLAPHLSVAENIFLGREPMRGPFVDRARLRAATLRVLDGLGADIDPAAPVRLLPVAQQQMVEIAKALSLNARVLIMDEPTSSLTDNEVDQLFVNIRALRDQGVGIIYISHRLAELEHVVDRVTVMRDGKHIRTSDFSAISLDDVVAAMVGRAFDHTFPRRTSRPTADKILDVQGLSRDGVFEDVSFDLHRGEILGFAGLMGAGRTEVARAIFGADPKSRGRVRLHGREVFVQSPRDAIRHGIAYLSEDRKAHGLALGMEIAANITMANLGAVTDGWGFLRFRDEDAAADKYVQALEIRTPSIHQIVKNLSGGNQQKVVIAKWLFRESKVLFFDEPTRGIDVGAKYAICEMLDRFAAQGIGVVLITSELPELLGMTDRVVVFNEGRVGAILDTARTSQEEIMQYASGQGTSPAAARDSIGPRDVPWS